MAGDNLTEVRGKIFKRGETVLLDGKSFVGCTFESLCRMVYRGEAQFAMKDTLVKNPYLIRFEGPAGKVLSQLRAMKNHLPVLIDQAIFAIKGEMPKKLQ